MPENIHLELVSGEYESVREFSDNLISDDKLLRLRAGELANNLVWVPSETSSHILLDRCRKVEDVLKPILRALDARWVGIEMSDDFRWLYDNVSLLSSELESVRLTFKRSQKLPHVRTPTQAIIPRVAALAEGYLTATAFKFSEKSSTSYIEAFEEKTALKMRELWSLVPVLKLVLLEQIAARGSKLVADPTGSHGVAVCVSSLRDVSQTPWKDLLEPLIPFDRILREDPTGDYARLDFESRDLYRNALAKIAEHSDVTEMQVATQAIMLSREAQQQQSDSRMAKRCSHVGYYLVAQGVDALHQRVGFKPPFAQRLSLLLRRHPNEFYLPAVELVTFSMLLAVALLLVSSQDSFLLILFSMLVLFLPCSQAAIQITNYVITSLLEPQIIPKLDLNEGIPEDCVTLVAVPSLLLEESQVRRLVDDLEVRFLGNHDRNMHFALLTDMPDSREEPREDSPLVILCSELIRGLNEKYAGEKTGSFFLFHRHRVYNPREKAWMGWERKRGKLMDLNRLLRQQYDSFPVKVGDCSILSRVRFVITLDSDTELPRGSAHRMVGALAHPLNQAIIDPENNIVVAGYGILQPRVGVSVQSTARSRLANIYSGETGFDIYTRAVSDVYQDLFGEGIFAGKGIYEVDTVSRVLEGRFPRNALLSHDLIEGAYARAGLASDIEVIEDYPSHYSAYNRRKHRWLRGDWQIAGWLLPNVPDESGQHVRNPISITSQWKIFDNLRRSLVEPAIFLLFLLDWLILPGSARNWTLVTLAILFLPAWFEFAFNLVRAVVERRRETAQDALTALLNGNVSVLLMVTFLAHQALLSVDAVVRTLIRRIVTRERLLEWETAAQAEQGVRTRTPVDVYLDWTPALAIALFFAVFSERRNSIFAALPVLLLWASSKLVSVWLNQPPRPLHDKIPARDETLLRRAALLTWRYFAEFCTEEHNWLIPDNVQEEPAVIAARISPTNLGFLLNARQVACEFGYLTVPELAHQSLRTLATVSKLQRYRGHLLNWYDTRSLAPLLPATVSTVDNGNLMASLWTLQQGCLELLSRPVLEPSVSEGFLDHLRILVDLGVFPRRRFAAFQREMKKEDRLQHLLTLPEANLKDLHQKAAKSKHSKDALWFSEQVHSRLKTTRRTVSSYAPWLLPEFAALRSNSEIWNSTITIPALAQMPEFIDILAARLRADIESNSAEELNPLYLGLEALLPEARSNVTRLIQDIQTVAATAGKFANEMDFGFLLDQRRKLLSVGFDVESQQVNAACYDLLATESRIAVFTAIAKEDIRQETWFLLGRAHTIDQGRPVLLSWTGTMFEYLMPMLWMRTFPNTLLTRSAVAAVRSQQAYALNKHVPWGISESAHFRMDEAGNYQYYAFGIPQLALRKHEVNSLVISPYSTFLALHVDAAASLQNLHNMADKGWMGSYGFYEAVDFTASTNRSWRRRGEIVRCWMAHHQGMSLLSIANLLHDNVVQRWFHGDPRVQATELLLHEKPVAHGRVAPSYGASAA
jgi:cyclic beta-1,2-glucan synthetase